VARQSNLVVTTSRPVSHAELKRRLIALVKKRGLPYGVIVRELGSPLAGTGDEPAAFFAAMTGRGGARGVFRAYRVYPDGREQLVRAARLSGVSAESFKDIVAASRAATVYHAAASTGYGLYGLAMAAMMEGGFFGEAPAAPVTSYAVPSLLFEDLALTRASPSELPKPPLSKPPTEGQE
jgi:hypothetical protein